MRLGVGARAFHVDRHEMRRAFRVGGHVAGQFPTHAVSGAAKRARLSPSSFGPSAVRQKDQRIVGAGVALDADAVERLVRGLRTSGARSAGITAASVNTNASIVAMFGPIIAAPLAKPVSRTSAPSRSGCASQS